MMFPVSGKREDSKAAWKNMIRPNGFLFSMGKGKKSDDEVLDMDDVDIAKGKYYILNELNIKI
jgi:hypothetical protein